jgi:hypothetical protein
VVVLGIGRDRRIYRLTRLQIKFGTTGKGPKKLIADDSQLVSVNKKNQLNLTVANGKKYFTDVADTKQIFL